MSLVMGKTETSAIVEVLKHEHASDVIKANALLEAFEEIFARRCKFCVVGQLSTQNGKDVPPADAPRIWLDWYSTEGDATKAAESLWSSSRGGNETWRTWVLPAIHSSAAAFHESRKEILVAAQQKAKEKRAQKIRDDIERRRKEMGVIVEREAAA